VFREEYAEASLGFMPECFASVSVYANGVFTDSDNSRLTLPGFGGQIPKSGQRGLNIAQRTRTVFTRAQKVEAVSLACSVSNVRLADCNS
jgi:hypothetical protein